MKLFLPSLIALILTFSAGWQALCAEMPAAQEDIARGDLLVEDDKLEEASEAYRSAIKKDPANSQAYQRLGKALSLSGDLDGAARACIKAIDLDNNNCLAHSNLGWVLGRQNRYREAVAEESIAIQLDPENVSAYLTLGLALTSLGDYDRAIKCYVRAIELDPENVRAYVNLAATMGRKGDFAGAVSAYKKALDLNPDSVAAHLGLGAALGKVGDLKGQISHFQEAVRLKPASDNAHGKLGWALYKAGDWQGAIREGCITNWLRLQETGPQFIQTFSFIWGAVFLLFGAIFAVIFVGSRMTPDSDEIVIKSYFLVFFRDKPGRFVITNKRIIFNPEAFSKWFGAEVVSMERDQILQIDSSLTGMRAQVTIGMLDGTQHEFSMPAFVFKPLRAQLQKTGARAQMKKTGQYSIPNLQEALAGIADGSESDRQTAEMVIGAVLEATMKPGAAKDLPLPEKKAPVEEKAAVPAKDAPPPAEPEAAAESVKPRKSSLPITKEVPVQVELDEIEAVAPPHVPAEPVAVSEAKAEEREPAPEPAQEAVSPPPEKKPLPEQKPPAKSQAKKKPRKKAKDVSPPPAPPDEKSPEG